MPQRSREPLERSTSEDEGRRRSKRLQRKSPSPVKERAEKLPLDLRLSFNKKKKDMNTRSAGRKTRAASNKTLEGAPKAAPSVKRATNKIGNEAEVKVTRGRPPRKRDAYERRVDFEDDTQTKNGYRTDESDGIQTEEEDNDRREDDASLHTALNGERDSELDASRAIKSLFGRWTREEAARAASRSEMLRLSFREDLQAALAVHQSESQVTLRQALADQRQKLEAVVEERLMAYTPAQEFRSLMDRVDTLSDKVRALSGDTRRHVKREDPRDLLTKSSAHYGQSDKVHWNPELEDEVDSVGDMQAHEPYLSNCRGSRGTQASEPFPTHNQGEDSTYTVSMPTFPRDWLGPPERGLVELRPADDRFSLVCSYRRYRLRLRESRATPGISRNLGVWQRRIAHVMQRNKFTGRRPLALLNFLASYKRTLDHNEIPEVGGLLLMHNFLEGDALSLFETMMNDAGSDTAGFTAWPHAVQFLLETYATDVNIEKAVDDLERIRLDPKETILEFKMRLTKAARELAGAYTQDALMTRFIRNLPSAIKDIVRLELPKLKDDVTGTYVPNALSKIAQVAEAYHQARASAPVKTTRFRSDPVSAVDGEEVHRGTDRLDDSPKSKAADLGPMPFRPQRREPHPMVAAVQSWYNPSDYAPSTFTDFTPTVEYSVRDDDPSVDPHAQVTHDWDVNAVDYARGRFPPRTQGRAPRPPMSKLIPTVCFRCYLTDHIAPDCPHKARDPNDPEFLRWSLTNFKKLQVWQQMWLMSIDRVPAMLAAESRQRLAMASEASVPPQVPSPSPVTAPAPASASAAQAQVAPKILQRPSDPKSTAGN